MKRFSDDVNYLRTLIDRNFEKTQRDKSNYNRKKEQKELEAQDALFTRVRNVQSIMQNFSHEEKIANKIKIEACKQMKLQLIEFFNQEIELVNNKRHTANYDKIKEIFNSKVVQVALKKLEEVSNEIKPFQISQYTEYETMFNTLIDTIDIKFALYAPAVCLKRRIAKLDKLPNDLKVIMNRRLDEFGLTNEANLNVQ